MSAAQFSALRLANALAVRLDAKVPSPIRVSAERPAPPLSEDDIVVQVANGAERWPPVELPELVNQRTIASLVLALFKAA